MLPTHLPRKMHVPVSGFSPYQWSSSSRDYSKRLYHALAHLPTADYALSELSCPYCEPVSLAEGDPGMLGLLSGRGMGSSFIFLGSKDWEADRVLACVGFTGSSE